MAAQQPKRLLCGQILASANYVVVTQKLNGHAEMPKRGGPNVCALPAHGEGCSPWRDAEARAGMLSQNVSANMISFVSYLLSLPTYIWAKLSRGA